MDVPHTVPLDSYGDHKIEAAIPRDHSQDTAHKVHLNQV